jgi:hypothetical protein
MAVAGQLRSLHVASAVCRIPAGFPTADFADTNTASEACHRTLRRLSRLGRAIVRGKLARVSPVNGKVSPEVVLRLVKLAKEAAFRN